MNAKSLYPYLFLLLALILSACSTPAPTPTATPVDPTIIAQGFWDAINAKNIDAAMAFLAEDVQIRGGKTNFSSKADFSAFMLSVSETITYEISNMKVVSEDTVSYTGKVYENSTMVASGYNRKVQIKDGKIALIELP